MRHVYQLIILFMKKSEKFLSIKIKTNVMKYAKSDFFFNSPIICPDVNSKDIWWAYLINIKLLKFNIFFLIQSAMAHSMYKISRSKENNCNPIYCSTLYINSYPMHFAMLFLLEFRLELWQIMCIDIKHQSRGQFHWTSLPLKYL